MINKKGTDKIISIYWFVILIIVAGGIFAMVSVFYGSPYDVRAIEAELLTNKIADCLSYGGGLDKELFIDADVLKGFKENFLELCKINFNVEEKFENEPQYYLKIGVFAIDSLNTPAVSLVEGNRNLVASCNVQEDKEFEKLAKCNKRKLYSTLNDQQYLIEILSIVKKTQENVK